MNKTAYALTYPHDLFVEIFTNIYSIKKCPKALFI